LLPENRVLQTKLLTLRTAPQRLKARDVIARPEGPGITQISTIETIEIGRENGKTGVEL
jgi:hypothetical protein